MTINHLETCVLLIADPDDTELTSTRQLLRYYCKHLICIDDTKKALELSIANKFELVLQDIDYFGLELVNRRKKPGSFDAPIIAISNTDKMSRRAIIQAGFDDCLIKPVKLILLKELLSLWQVSQKNDQALTYIVSMLSKTANNQELAINIFQKLFIELPLQITEIEGALKNKQFEVARQATHKLNGSVSLCGFYDLQRSAQKLEACLTHHHYADVDNMFEILKKYITHFMALHQSILTYFEQ